MDAESLGIGLTATFRDRTEEHAMGTDTLIVPALALYVQEGQSPTPFLAPGPFSVEWRGAIVVDVRDDYRFQAEVQGHFVLRINGEPVLDLTNTPAAAHPPAPIRLRKGTNALEAEFHSPARGDASVRLRWATPELPPAPIPTRALAAARSPALETAERRHRGRAWFFEYRCLRCHDTGAQAPAAPDAALDGPSLVEIGSRRRRAWLERWILDPRSERAGARMPRMRHGPGAAEDSAAMAGYLASLGGGTSNGREAVADAPRVELVQRGAALFESLQCSACHPGATSPNPMVETLPLQRVNEKFQFSALATYMHAPEAHDRWTRMPRFALEQSDASALAAFLMASATNTLTPKALRVDPEPAQRTLVESGRALVQSLGCLQCHALEIENRYVARPVPDWRAANLGRGCLAENDADRATAPAFAFGPEQRLDLRAFLSEAPESMRRHSVIDFTARNLARLNCAACHGRVPGATRLEILGEKLKPEWLSAFISGADAERPRPWLEARMPAFPAWGGALASGLAQAHGLPNSTPAEPALDNDAAEVGRRLAGRSRGFACVACHAVAGRQEAQATDTPGLDFARIAARLHYNYFERWMLNPLLIDPGTKMPRYFDDQDASPLTEVYGGDGARQIHAIWQYLRLGNRMRSPEP